MALSIPTIPGLAAVVGICGFLPETEQLDIGSGPAALLLAGQHDEETPAFLSEDAAISMRLAGRDATPRTLPGGHTVTPQAALEARGWLQDRVEPRVRFSVGLPTERVSAAEEFVSADAIYELAGLYEELGFDATFVTDHPAPDDRWLAGGGHHALEPTVALATAGAATTVLRLHTHVYVLAYRNPFLAAKALASLDVVSGGRVILGVAAGYLKPEFNAVGADFEKRGERLDEALALLSQIWSGETVSVDTDEFTARGVTALPRPLQRPEPPVWIGGNSRRAMRRAVAFGQGWSPFPTSEELARYARTAAIADVGDLTERIEEFRTAWADAGREGVPAVCFGPFSMGGYMDDPRGGIAQLVEECEELYQLGVNWLTLSIPGSTRSELSENARRLSEALGLEPPEAPTGARTRPPGSPLSASGRTPLRDDLFHRRQPGERAMVCLSTASP